MTLGLSKLSLLSSVFVFVPNTVVVVILLLVMTTSGKIKIDPYRITRDELLYELQVRGLGEGTNLTVTDLRTAFKNALSLEKTSLAIEPPPYPYTFAEDMTALTENLERINNLILEFSGIQGDSKFKGIVSHIAHSIGRVNRSNPQQEEDKKFKADFRLKLLLAYDRLVECVKKQRRARDSTVFDLSVLRHTVEQPNAHSSRVESDSDSSDSELVSKIKPVPIRDWGLKFSGRKGDMSFCTFVERIEDMRRSRGVSHAILFRDAVDLFVGDAYTWYNMVKEWATDWSSLMNLMREQFLPENFDSDLFEEIKRRSQGSQENIGLYIASMKGLFNKMHNPLPEATQLEIIMERIDPFYQPFLTFETVTSVTSLLSACRKLDIKRNLAKTFVPPPPKHTCLIPELAYASTSSDNLSIDSGNSRRSVREINEISVSRNSAPMETSSPSTATKCWNCGEIGHISRRCPKPQTRYCYHCGHVGVTVRNCPKCSNSGNGLTRRQ